MKRKSDLATLFPQFKILVEIFFQTQIISLFTANGGEYVGLIQFLQTHGISHFTTPTHTPEQKGFAKPRHRHIVETSLSILRFANFPICFGPMPFKR